MNTRFQDKVEERKRMKIIKLYTDLYQLMPANYVFTYLHCLGSDCVGVMPAECDVAKRQDVACVEDVKLLPEHRKRSPVRNLSWVVRTVFFLFF